jgi:hypothetical protein
MWVEAKGSAPEETRTSFSPVAWCYSQYGRLADVYLCDRGVHHGNMYVAIFPF